MILCDSAQLVCLYFTYQWRVNTTTEGSVTPQGLELFTFGRIS